jgi:hypothetical protein
MSLDAHKNFAYSTVATAPSTPTAGTSLVVAAADGTKFPAVPFNAVIWPVGVLPTATNAEIVRVTNIATDTFTITRTQESSANRTVVIGDQIMAGPTAKSMKDIEDYLTGVSSPTLLTPTIASHTNAQHDHTNAANGGLVAALGLPTGVAVQVVGNVSSAVGTGTTIIPEDDTIPQNTEGDQYLTQAITPKATTDRLLIIAKLQVSVSNVNSALAALFQDSTAGALAAAECYIPVGSATGNIWLVHDMAAGTVSATTFKVRVGPAIAGTLTLNGFGGARKFGGISCSSLHIIEYRG